MRPAGLEAPKQVGRVERRNAVLKKMAQKVIRKTKAIGISHMDMAIIGKATALYISAPMPWSILVQPPLFATIWFCMCLFWLIIKENVWRFVLHAERGIVVIRLHVRVGVRLDPVSRNT